MIRTKYPHVKPRKKRKTFTKREQIALFMHDGFIDRYSGDRLIFLGVLCIFSKTLPEIFPYHPPSKLEDWDDLTVCFMNYIGENPAWLLNNDVNN